MADKITVLKFGGKTLASPESFLKIAESISDFEDHRKFIIVVSAMGETTNDLYQLAHKVNQNPGKREIDMLLTAGERISMALMSLALDTKKISAISFTGSQAGILTDCSHGIARIKDLKPIRIEEEIKERTAVIVAGFQGVDPASKEVTTLGRGGSDTTAVAFSIHFKANDCLLLKDVGGVYSIDPKKSNSAKFIENLTFDEAIEMCFWGYEFVHIRALALAKKHGQNIAVNHPTEFNKKKKTVITEGKKMESSTITALVSKKNVYKLTVDSNNFDIADELTVLNTTAVGKSTVVIASSESAPTSWPNCENLHSYTAVFSGGIQPRYIQHMEKAICNLGGKIQGSQIHPQSITFFINPTNQENFEAKLHGQMLELG